MEDIQFNKLPVRHCLIVLKEEPHELERAAPEFFETHYPELTKEERLETLRLTYKLAGLRAGRLEQDCYQHARENSRAPFETWEASSHAFQYGMAEFFEVFTRLSLYLLHLERQEHKGNENAGTAAAAA